MKKIAICTAAFLALGLLISGTAGAGGVKQDICHVKGNGDVILISTSENAVSAHLAHGDFLPGDIIDGQFACDDCTTVEVEEVVSNELSFSSTGWGGWSCPTGTFAVDCSVDVDPGPVAQILIWEPGASESGGVTYPNTPFSYTYTPPETGCIVQNGGVGQKIFITVTCADSCE